MNEILKKILGKRTLSVSEARPDFIIKTQKGDPGFHAVYKAPTSEERQKMLLEEWKHLNGK